MLLDKFLNCLRKLLLSRQCPLKSYGFCMVCNSQSFCCQGVAAASCLSTEVILSLVCSLLADSKICQASEECLGVSSISRNIYVVHSIYWNDVLRQMCNIL